MAHSQSGSPQAILDKLEKLKTRLRGKTLTMPGEGCQGVDFHLAGMFLKVHVDYLIQLVKEDIDGN